MSERKRDYLPFWTCYEKNTPYGNQYIQLTRDLVESKEFCSLTYAAQILYIRMSEVACGNPSFRYSDADYKGRMSRDGFLKAKKQLIEKGFIYVTNEEANRLNKKPTEFHFSRAWKPTEKAKQAERAAKKVNGTGIPPKEADKGVIEEQQEAPAP